MNLNLKTTFVLIIAVSNSFSIFAQTSQKKGGFWILDSWQGSVLAETIFQFKETKLNSLLSERNKLNTYSGEIEFNSQSYILHPNFLLVDAGILYNPTTRNNDFMVNPTRSEIKNAESAKLGITLFNERPINLKMFYNFDHSFSKRELLTDLETFRKSFSTSFLYSNNFLPFTISYNANKWEQKELLTGRSLKDKRNIFKAEITKSFSDSDEHKISLFYDKFDRLYSGLATKNSIAYIKLYNNFNFNKELSNSFNSTAEFYKQSGAARLERLQIDETIRYDLPKNFKLFTTYRFSNILTDQTRSRQNNVTGRIRHQLFKSLSSYISIAYRDFDYTAYFDKTTELSSGFAYTKKIALGTLNLTYNYWSRKDTRNAESVFILFENEIHFLEDTETVLLDNPSAKPESVIITNGDGTFIYQENFDYQLVERGNSLEIIRIPGGRIERGAKVLVDYEVTQNTSFKYDTKGKNFSAGYSLFSNLISFFYRFNNQSFDNIEIDKNKILKTIEQRVYGVRFLYGVLSGGVEFDDFDSNIMPFYSKRFYLRLTKNFNNQFSFSINGNLNDYYYKEENTHQKYNNVNGIFIFQLSKRTQLNFEGSYLLQKGRRVDLGLLALKAELKTVYRKLLLLFGFEAFKRNYFFEDIKYLNYYIKIKREF